MRTWQMIKELTENPTKKFRTANIGCEPESDVTASLGEIIIGGYPKLYVTDKWEEIKEPVSFMVAVESGKKIRVEHNTFVVYLATDFKPLSIVLSMLESSFSSTQIKDIILNGKFYIED